MISCSTSFDNCLWLHRTETAVTYGLVFLSSPANKLSRPQVSFTHKSSRPQVSHHVKGLSGLTFHVPAIVPDHGGLHIIES